MAQKKPRCAQCPFEPEVRRCRVENGEGPLFCPTDQDDDILEKCLAEYENKNIQMFARQASIQEGEGYSNREKGYDNVVPQKPRILEIVEFAHRMNYKKLGLAFCSGLRREAEIVSRFFSQKGFDVVSVICKVGRIPKEHIGVLDEQKIAIGHPESMCNPIYQAKLLNVHRTEFNVVLGLCVGHDSLFFQYSQAPCTVLIVKDRVLGHNPAAAIYTLDSYYRSFKS